MDKFKFLDSYKCIAIAGNNGAGKTTFAKKFTDTKKVVSFASKLRDISSVVLNIPADDLKELNVKESSTAMFEGRTVRDVMITLASSIRSMNNDYFASSTLASIDDATRIIIDDLRFEVEVSAILKKYRPDEVAFILLKKEGEEYMGDLPEHMFEYTIIRSGDDFTL